MIFINNMRRESIMIMSLLVDIEIDEIKTSLDNCDINEKEEYEPPNILGLSLLKGYQLMPYQIDTINFMKEKESITTNGIRGGLCQLQPGLGKSLVAISKCM